MPKIIILHLEDSLLDAELAFARLERGGIDCEVRRVETRTEFITALQQSGFDLILSDFALPDFDGEAALKHARSVCPDTPFIFVSGKLGEEVAIDTLKQGATDYVLKQRLDRLVPAVERALAETQERQRRRETEEALRLSEERMHVAVKHSPLILYTADCNLCYTWIGKAYAHFAPALLLGKRDDQVLPAQDVAELTTLKQSVVETGVGMRAVVRITIYGSQEVYDTTVEPLRDGQGHIIGITVAALDITELRHKEAELQRHKQETDALNSRLKRAMTETHHRVKNNLQLIAAMLDMRLMDGQPTISAHEIKRLGNYVRTLATVHDILTQQAKSDGQAHTLSAKQVLEELLSMIQAGTSGRTIEASIEDACLTARQGTSLAIVTNELVSNALKHGRGKVEVALHVKSNTATLIVSDDGPGFPPDFKPAVAANTGLEIIEHLSRWDLGATAEYVNRPGGGGMVRIPIAVQGIEEVSSHSVLT